MSSLYLLESHTSPMSSAKIIDLVVGTTLTHEGGFVVPVKDNLNVINPTNFTDLITKKYLAVQASYPGFTNIVYDDLCDTTGIDFSVPTTSGSFGDRGCTRLSTGGTFTSIPQSLSSTPIQAVVIWESALKQISTFPNTHGVKYFAENNYLTCEVSFNGTTWLTATNGGILVISPADQGNQLRVRISNFLGTTVSPVGWAVVY